MAAVSTSFSPSNWSSGDCSYTYHRSLLQNVSFCSILTEFRTITNTKDQAEAIMTVPDEVDIIVVGGGSCGCVVAGRLANLDHNLQVMLIEAGESNLNVRLTEEIRSDQRLTC
jgi:NADH dehydrogenase FAD-containing subunit